METPYDVNNLLLLLAQIYTMSAIFTDNTTDIMSICPQSQLYVTLPLAIIVYIYTYNIYKLRTNYIVNIINFFVFLSCAIFILTQIGFICSNKLSITNTYCAAILNSCVFIWFGCGNIKKIIEEYGVIVNP